MGIKTGIPFIDNAVGDGPAQQAAAQNKQQDYAQNVSSAGATLANSQQQQALANMFMRFQQYMAQNPQVAQTWQALKPPNQNGQTVGGGTIGSAGYGGASSVPGTSFNGGSSTPSQPIQGVQQPQPNPTSQYAGLSPQALAAAMQSMQIPVGQLATASTNPANGYQIQAVRGPAI